MMESTGDIWNRSQRATSGECHPIWMNVVRKSVDVAIITVELRGYFRLPRVRAKETLFGLFQPSSGDL